MFFWAFSKAEKGDRVSIAPYVITAKYLLAQPLVGLDLMRWLY